VASAIAQLRIGDLVRRQRGDLDGRAADAVHVNRIDHHLPLVPVRGRLQPKAHV
jgi:hypothetical protein